MVSKLILRLINRDVMPRVPANVNGEQRLRTTDDVQFHSLTVDDFEFGNSLVPLTAEAVDNVDSVTVVSTPYIHLNGTFYTMKFSMTVTPTVENTITRVRIPLVYSVFYTGLLSGSVENGIHPLPVPQYSISVSGAFVYIAFISQNTSDHYLYIHLTYSV